MKEIILSGRQGSGKTWLSEAFAAPLLEKEVFRTTGQEARKWMTAPEKPTILMPFRLIIIDECRQSDITELSVFFNNQKTIVLPPMYHCLKRNETTIVYCTQALIDRKEVDVRFLVFNL